MMPNIVQVAIKVPFEQRAPDSLLAEFRKEVEFIALLPKGCHHPHTHTAQCNHITFPYRWLPVLWSNTRIV